MKISILNKNELENEFTIGAEFYQPYYVQKVDKIKSKNNVYLLGNLCFLITDGDHSATQYTDDGILYLLSESVKEGYIDTNIKRYISSDLHNSLKRSKLKPRNILLTKTGVYFGKSAVIPDDFPEANTSAHVGKFVVKEEIINPYYLSTFFNCEYGYSQLRRRGIKASRPEIKLIEFFDIKVYVAAKYFQNIIEKTIKKSIAILDESKEKIDFSKNLLLSELGITNWQPKHKLFFIKNYSDTEQSKRIDAEYFQPKYDEIINAIKAYKGGWDALGNLVDVKKSIEVGRGEYLDEGIPFVRVSNISLFELSEGKYISEQLYAELTQDEQDIPFEKSKTHQPQQGEILFSKDGSPGIAYYLKDKPQKMVVSGGILRLQSKADTINNEYLTLVLNSVLTQEQVKRDVGGSIILHWRPEQVKETIIPILPQAQQLQIQQKITESFELRKQSKQLLENAKRAVEIAIEQDESKAIQWLDAQLV
ncbi:type I restriction enzyme M protein [Bathymodiolus platifrons methanotrophic gill symbiont]|uniref:hypothetical protein n=1 Tax=Bathymodiolus platifrons methanotrophic gill symbiont TaxID=113268 RepID=UPI000B41BB60|nr:hypothetical protein [Bathymodiolus platifrons methanotrophic gill symbiont]GAW86475.1 type I restriction enzyme M protein [Bathymodiolus platifrons methanotrophic gill symbiont]GFO76471.1 type I restriction enzyme, S subunit [Bathymodiolus platifrons methanotrophic gill symbiont]